MNTLSEQARIAANWIESVSKEKSCIRTEFPEFCVINTQNPRPTPEEFADELRFMATQADHPSFITVYQAINGWQTMAVGWTVDDAEDPGCYVPYNTGCGPYGHTLEGYNVACQEAKQWAKDESIICKEFPKFEPLKTGEPSNVLEAMKQMSDKRGILCTIVNLETGVSEDYVPLVKHQDDQWYGH